MRKVTKANKPSINASIGERILYVRSNLGMSQQELADKIDIKRQEITMYESNERKMSIDKLKSIAQVLNVSTDYLLGISELESADIDIRGINEKTGLSSTAIQNLIYLKKYHNEYMIPTINYLLEQEQLFPNEYYDIAINGNLDKASKEEYNEQYNRLSQATKDFATKDYKRIINAIDTFFNTKIESKEEIYITNNSIKKLDNIREIRVLDNLNAITLSKDIADTVLLNNIDKLLEEAKEKLTSDNNRNEAE